MFKFSCYPEGGKKFTVVARSRVIAAWENAPGQPKDSHRSIGEFTKNMQMSEAVDLAWYAASKSGQTTLDIREWREQVDVDFEEYKTEEELEAAIEAGPTQPAP